MVRNSDFTGGTQSQCFREFKLVIPGEFSNAAKKQRHFLGRNHELWRGLPSHFFTPRAQIHGGHCYESDLSGKCPILAYDVPVMQSDAPRSVAAKCALCEWCATRVVAEDSLWIERNAHDLARLDCPFCGHVTSFRWSEMRRYLVSVAILKRGYGASEEAPLA